MSQTPVTNGKGGGQAKQGPSTQDDHIMGTNDSSIVSKRSVCRFYYPTEPDFYEPFVTKFQRRNPLINRGYWLRMNAIEQAVLRFLREDSNGRPKAVVNLGCGYDPLPWQFMHRHASLCADAMFVDVDYPQLMQKKVKAIQMHDLLLRYLPDMVTETGSESVFARSGSRYAAVGCNLRELPTVEATLRDQLGLGDSSVIFVAEVSITYMGVEDADRLIRWASSMRNSQFCLLEQFLPCGPHHPFAKTMLAHFNKLHSPIYAARKYPTLGQQQGRFKKLGWLSAQVESLWDYWSNLDTITREERRELDMVEPFDEWEEFALFAGHYFVLSARNTPSDNWKIPRHKASHPTDIAASRTIVRVSRRPFDPQATRNLPDGMFHTSRRFAATFKSPTGKIFIHSGLGQQKRLNTMQSAYDRDTEQELAILSIPGRMCHTVSYCGPDPNREDNRYLLVGGRLSPQNVQSDYFVRSNGEHISLEENSISPGRFRHCAVEICVTAGDSSVHGVLVFGGKTSAGEVLQDWQFWDAQKGWQEVPCKGLTPAARFGAALASTNDCRGVLIGGMDDCGNILSDFIEWEFSLIDGIPEINCRDRAQDMTHEPLHSCYARFGAILLGWKSKLLLVGGIVPRRILKMDRDILQISVEANSISMESVQLECGAEDHPLLIGFGAQALPNEEILILGGGAVCFSMGSFLNPPKIVLTASAASSVVSGPSHEKASLQILQNQVLNGPAGAIDAGAVPTLTALTSQVPLQQVPEVSRMQVHTAQDFDAIVAAGRPIIIEGQALGPCTDLWTPEYLIDRVGHDREVVIHSTKSTRLTFQHKNFSYTKQGFGDFIHAIQAGEKLYLRSVSTAQPFKQPTHLATDFPGLAQDFNLPSAPFTRVLAAAHSSPLRISGPVTLWLHYDVLANLLCQIRGTKTLRLHPPSDVAHLGIPAGASSSDIDIFGSAEDTGDAGNESEAPLPRYLRHLSGTANPLDAKLRPGDVLYVPPMWMHGARPEEGWSVAVNVFFRDLAPEVYAVGRDVYGNRDLRGYEEGRKLVERIGKGFEGVPKDVRAFYLERLAEELRELARKGSGDGNKDVGGG